MNSISTHTEKSMSSLEVAKLTGKRHDNVIRDIEVILDELEIGRLKFLHTYLDGANRQSKCYNLNEELTLTLVAGYNIKMRSAIIKRWKELEANVPMSLEDMTVFVLEGQKKKILELEQKIEDDRPITEFGKAISQSAGTCKVGDWVKAINDSGEISIGRNKAFDLLRRKGYLGKDNMPYQSKIDQGLFQVKESMVVSDTRTLQIFTPLLTGKGQMFLAGKFKEWLL
jgi:anti-repressor protein